VIFPPRNQSSADERHREDIMFPVKGVAHFSIPVSDLERSTKFYTEVIGCRFLSSAPKVGYVFLDAGGVAIILVKRDKPVPNPEPDHNGVHHSFMFDSAVYPSVLKHLAANDVKIFFEEDREDGVILGPRVYFRDPDGTVLEIMDRTSYKGDQAN
jgi:glyoxylase I family protein